MKIRILFLIAIFCMVSLSCQLLTSKSSMFESGDLLYKDGFSDPRSGWDRVQKQEYLADYADGVYRIKVSEPNVDVWANPGLSFDNVIVEVDATKGGGPDDNNFGVICRSDQDAHRFYYFVISSDGYYGIGKVKDNMQVLLGWDSMQPSEYIRQGYALNHIRADCVDNRLALYVNGEKILETKDDSYISGDVGMIAGSFDIPGVDIYFDNFLVLKP